jgi:(p)ppGpp synthase/HD superfamily hydrolase
MATSSKDQKDKSSVSLSPRFEQAFSYAFKLHKNQKRKATNVPYIAHLLGVTALVLEAGGDEDEAIAALLHDAAEDQGGQRTLNAIEDQFGVRVARIVAECSDSISIFKAPWKQRKSQYLARLSNADMSVRRVSLADKLHNCRDILRTYREIGDETWARFSGGKDGTLWYYEELVRIFLQTGRDSYTLELERVFSELSEAAGHKPYLAEA